MRPSQSAAALIIGTTGSRPGSNSGREGRPASAGGNSAGGGNSKSKSLVEALRTPRKPFNWDQEQKFSKVEFTNAAGNYGLIYDGQIVTCVQDQARKLGVKPGWKIEMVDGVLVNNSVDIWARLQEAKWQWRSCYISFLTDMKAIKREQWEMRVAENKAEVERLAKLPFTDAKDPKHLEQIKEFITFQGYIDHREDRAITLPQVKTVIRWAKDHCHRWRDADPPELSRTSRMHLSMNFINTYHLNHWLIRPATLEKDCSFVEMLTNQKQPAEWFVIHWWGDRLLDVVRCLELQMQTRELPEKSAFWIGVFAFKPHSMADHVAVNPEATCYFRAMKQAKFQVLLILDSKTEHSGPCTPFKRAWCGYEMSMTLGQNENNVTVDIATCEGPRPSLITQGLTKVEEQAEILDNGAGYRQKAEREKHFSLDLVGLALNIQIQNGATVRPLDKQRILNSIAQRDLALPAEPKHDEYNKTNQRIRSVLALAMFRRVLQCAGENVDFAQVQLKVVQALKGDEWRPSFDLSMAYMPGTDIDEKLKVVCQNIPPTAQHLSLDLRGCEITGDTLSALALALPRGLQSLQLDLGGNAKIDNLAIEQMVPKLPPVMERLRMNLQGTITTKEVQEKQNELDDLKQHIVDEAERGTWVLYMNLCPSATGRMITCSHKEKLENKVKQ